MATYIESSPKGCTAYKRWIVIVDDFKEASKAATYTKKVLEFLFNAFLANFFLLLNSTYLVVGRALARVYGY